MNSKLIRTTINFTPGAQADLEDAMQIGGDSKSDTINKAVRLYAKALRAEHDKGEILIRARADAELHKIEFL